MDGFPSVGAVSLSCVTTKTVVRFGQRGRRVSACSREVSQEQPQPGHPLGQECACPGHMPGVSVAGDAKATVT